MLICTLCLLFAPTAAFAEEYSDPPIILLDKGETDGNRVEIIATLAKNSGIMGMTLTLNYDDSALKLVEVTDGTALSALKPVHSGSVSTKPYKINYMWQDRENDYSTGVLLKFIFEIKEGAKNGTYKVSIKSEKKGVEYLEDETLKYKNLVSDSATITVQGTETVVEVVPGKDIEPDETDGSQITLILIPVCVAAALSVTLTAILVLRKGKRSK